MSKDTKTEMVSDTVEFRHHKLTLTSVTPENKVLHGVQKLTEELKNTPASTVDAQLQAIKANQDTIEHWEEDTQEPIATADLPRCNLSTKKALRFKGAKRRTRYATGSKGELPPSKGATHFNRGHTSQSSANCPTHALPIGSKAIGTCNNDRTTGGPSY